MAVAQLESLASPQFRTLLADFARSHSFATKAALRFGEIARGVPENGNTALVELKSGRRKVFCDVSKADSAKVFVPEGNITVDGFNGFEYYIQDV